MVDTHRRQDNFIFFLLLLGF